jgi:UDP-3-O-[3-hydroxymyristoyl] glucosamine N-acyltransferase LpxD
MTKVTSKIIADFLSKNLIGKDIIITGPSPIDSIKKDTFFFVKSKFIKNFKIPNNTLAIASKQIPIPKNASLIISKNPRYDFIKIINKFFVKEFKFNIDRNVTIPKSCLIDKDVFIGKNVTIGENVRIGKNSKIYSNVYIGDNVVIGRNSTIKPGAILGTAGFGFGFDDDNSEPIEFNHSGSVEIGNNVHIGANTCIDQGTFSNTIIEDNVKIDNLVHISHNCIIRKNSIIIACAEISGGVIIDESCWISPNVSIKQKCHIGKKSFIGLGAVVIKDIPENTKVMGVGALSLKQFLSLKKILD